MLATVTAHHRELQGQGDALARRFELANERVIRVLEQSRGSRARRLGASVRTSFVADARHVAEAHLSLARFVQAVATGRPLPPLGSGCADARTRRPERLVPSDDAETLELLRSHGALAASLLRGLSDDQLERSSSYFGTKLSAAQLVDELLIAHIEEHLGDLREIVSARPARHTLGEHARRRPFTLGRPGRRQQQPIR